MRWCSACGVMAAWGLSCRRRSQSPSNDNAAVSLDGLCDLLRQLNPQAAMTPQALHQRILSPHAGTYVHAVLQLALRENLEPVRAQLPAALLAPFGRVFL